MPHKAIPLSDLGYLQALKLADLHDMPPLAVLVSSMVRTHQTAEPFCRRFSLFPQVCPSLDEFSLIDPALIAGLDNTQRKPFVQAYWDESDPMRRMGVNAETFAEFAARVSLFMVDMQTLSDSTVIFGHGIWFGLLHWLLLGYSANDAANMRAFRRFQLALPMPNCAVFSLSQIGGKRWNIQANTKLMRHIASVTA